MPFRFQYPELLLLAIPLWFAFRRCGRTRGVTGWLRGSVLGALLLALAGLELNISGPGVDVIVLADRSRSMPDEAQANVDELIENLARNRGAGDRLAVVTFGGTAQIEQILSGTGLPEKESRPVSPDGSDLDAAVTAALALVAEDRPTRILVLSDGEANGRSPASAARRAREVGVPVDFRVFERLTVGDAAVESLLLPETVSPGEPFQFSALIDSGRPVRADVKLLRDGRLIASTQRSLRAGPNRVLFGDRLDEPGISHYRVEIDVLDDPILENNVGAGVVRADEPPRLLVLSADGAEGNLVRTLRAALLPVDVGTAESHPLTQDALDRYRAVILEDVPAAHLGRLKMERLDQFVVDLGGGLLLTGGERSFGAGGYFKSPLDDILPVSMELRDEHRKSRVALAIALDRSGSMGAVVKGGGTKMDLANLAAAECVRLLAPIDMVSVLAVDVEPHVVQPLTTVVDPEGISANVLRIEGGGGGIYVYEALEAAGKELAKAPHNQMRHIILFSDAADSEHPGDYRDLLTDFQLAGITVSVIGLGTETNTDADLLQEIARLGRGNILFTDDANELPRLFTQETLNIVRNTFITPGDDQPNGIPARLLPDSRLIGSFPATGFPNVGGYNLSYLRPDATLAVVSQDEFKAPLSAAWYRGLGRVAALTIEVDGRHTGGFGGWESYDEFLVTHARWLLGGEPPDAVFVDVSRSGQDAVVSVELDPDRRAKWEGAIEPSLVVVPPGLEPEASLSPRFRWSGPHSLEARFRLDRTGAWRTLVKLGDRGFVRGPAVTLPYSPEFAPRGDRPTGRETLAEMAKLSGGVERTDVLEVLSDPPRAAEMLSLIPWLLGLSICLLLAEIAGRRLMLWERHQAATESQPEAVAVKPGWLPKWRWRSRPVTGTPDQREASPMPPTESGDDRTRSRPALQPANVFAQAKSRAKRRLEDG